MSVTWDILVLTIRKVLTVSTSKLQMSCRLTLTSLLRMLSGESDKYVQNVSSTDSGFRNSQGLSQQHLPFFFPLLPVCYDAYSHPPT